MKLTDHHKDILRKPMKLRTFVDMFTYCEKLKEGSNNEKITIIQKRKRKAQGQAIIEYRAVRMLPHVYMSNADPASKYFPKFCQTMVLCSAEFDKIIETVQSEIRNIGPDPTPEDIDTYWIDKFYTCFPPPHFPELEPAYQSHAIHYYNKRNNIKDDFSDSEEEEGFDTTEIRYEDLMKNTTDDGANAKTVRDKYYQNPDDILNAPLGNDSFIEEEIEKDDPNLERMHQLSDDFLQLPTVESDCRKWADTFLDLDDGNLETQIATRYKLMDDKVGNSTPDNIPINPDLTQKQELLKDIIVTWVKDRVKENNGGPPVDP